MNEKKKKFLVPEVEIVDFSKEDIITASALAYDENNATADWDEGPSDNW